MAQLDFSRLRRLDTDTAPLPATAPPSQPTASALDFSRLKRMERSSVADAMAGRTGGTDAYRRLTGSAEALTTVGQPAGLVEAGNIDLTKRPKVKNADGSISTVRSISFGTDKGEVLIPTVIGDRVVSDDDAKKHYFRTGENLGVFDTPDNATAYAESLHQQQDRLYSASQPQFTPRSSPRGYPGMAAAPQAVGQGTAKPPELAEYDTFHEQPVLTRNVINPAKEGVANIQQAAGAGYASTRAEKLKALDDIETMERLEDRRNFVGLDGRFNEAQYEKARESVSGLFSDPSGQGRNLDPTAYAAHLNEPDISQYVSTRDPQKRAEIRRGLQREFVATILNTAKVRRDIAKLPQDEEFNRIMQSGTAGDFLNAIIDDPARLVRLGVSSAVTSAPGIAAIPVVGPAPAMGASSFFLENGLGILDSFAAAGVDISDPEALRKAFSDPAMLAAARSYGVKAGISVGLFDAIAGGMASKMLAPAKIAGKTLTPAAREVANIVPQTAVQGALGGAGEATKQVATGQPLSMPNILAEVAGEGVSAVTEVPAVRSLAREGLVAPKAQPTVVQPSAAVPSSQPTAAPPVAAAQPLAEIVMMDPATGEPIPPAPPASGAPPREAASVPPAAAAERPGRPNTRAELQRLLDDERPLAEIQAEERARTEATRLAEAERTRVVTEAQAQAEARTELERSAAERERLARSNIYGQFDTEIAVLDRGIAQQRQALGLVEGDGTRAAPVKVEEAADLHVGTERTAQPTPAQAEAGNYPKRHLKWKGLDIAIETEAGQVRTGIDRNGRPWSSESPAPYGYIKGTMGRDKDHLDIYMGPAPDAPQVFVVDQIDPATGAFDEHKIVAGARNLTEAVDIYDAGFSDGSGPARRGAVTRLNLPEFKTWLAKGDTTKALAHRTAKIDSGEAVAPTATAEPPAAQHPQGSPTAQTAESISQGGAIQAPAETDASLIDRITAAISGRASPTVQVASLAQEIGASVDAVRQVLGHMANTGAGIRRTESPGVFRRETQSTTLSSPSNEGVQAAASAAAEVRQRTPGDIQPSPAGRFSNEIEELRAFAGAQPRLKGHEAAAAFVLAKQQADGLEHVVIVGADGSEPRAAFTSGARDRTTIPDDVMALLSDPNANVVLHHNHPLNVGFSPEDLGMLSLPGMRVVAAHSVRASYSATLTDETRELAVRHGSVAYEAFLGVPDAAWNAARDVLMEAGARGEVTASQINALVPHIAALATERAGMIEYRQGGLPGDFVFRHVAGRKALDRATAAANLAYRRAKAALEKIDGKDQPRGPAGPGSISQRPGGIPREGQRLAKGRRGSEIRGAPRRARPGGPPEDGARPGGAERQSQSVTPTRPELRQRQATDLFGPGFTASPASVRDALMASARSRTERMRAAAGAALDRFRIGAQDKMLRLKRIQEAIEAARGAALPANHDAYLGEELYHGITGELIDRFRVERIEPLAKAISEAGVTVEQVNEFLLARHAPERNAQIAKINPDMPDGGSGMTNAEAAEAMDRFRADGLYDKLDRIAREHVDPVIRDTVETLTKGDLIDAQARIAWNQTYKHYVPLRGFEQGGEAAERLETERARIGRGFDIRGEESKRALGRRSRAGDILAHLIAAHEEAIVRAEKNKVGKTFLRLVQANPNPELWEVDTAPLKRVVDERSGLVTYERDPRYILADNVMAVKVGGEAHYVTIHDPLLARAMKNLGAESMNGFIRAVNAVMRLLAKLLTQWNPAFTIPNLVRDLQTALINIQAQDVPQIAGQIVRDVPAAMKGAFQGARGRADTEWQRWYREFGESGGKIGFFGLEDIETRASKLRAMVRDLGPGNLAMTRRTLRAVGQLVSDLNGAVENATRLSAYANLRRKGVPKEKAASIARNLTVNFNRRGEWGPYLNAAYIFYNASLQGSVTMVKALARSRKVQAIAVGGVLLGVLQDILNHALSPDDDETGENRWDAKVGEWTKDHNLVFMNPWADGDDNMVAFKLPLPYGYNIFPMIGRRISETFRGKEGATAARSAAQVIAGTFDSFSPVGSGSTLFDGWEGFVRGVSPTLMQPMVEIAVNMDYKGDPIQRSKEQYGRPIPEHMRGFRNTGPVAAWVTKQLAEMTGGSDVREGAIDISPAAIDHLAEFFTGGAGRTLKQALELPIRGVEGDWDEFSNPRNWPVANRFIEGKNRWYDNARFYDIAGAVEITEAEMKAAAKAGDTERQKEIESAHGAEVSVIGRFRVTEKRLAAMRKAMAAAEAAGDKKRVEELQQQITALQRAAIRAYVEALKTSQ